MFKEAEDILQTKGIFNTSPINVGNEALDCTEREISHANQLSHFEPEDPDLPIILKTLTENDELLLILVITKHKVNIQYTKYTTYRTLPLLSVFFNPTPPKFAIYTEL